MIAATKATATFVRSLDGWTGDARLYRMAPPMPTYDPACEWDTPSEPAEYVVVSGTIVPFSGTETYIFAADESGQPVTWRALAGSFHGSIDHGAALARAGYDVASK